MKGSVENGDYVTNADRKTWVIHPESLEEQIWSYCKIRHFPSASPHLRVSQVRLQPGSPGPVIRHNESAELVRIIEGEALVYLDGATSIEKADTTLYIPPGTMHGFKALEDDCLLFVVHVPAISSSDDHTVVHEDFGLVPTT